MIPALPAAEPRLQRRYSQLLVSSLTPAQSVAAGIHGLPGVSSAFAAAQAAWRFYSNERLELSQLAQPLIDYARQQVPSACEQYVLVALDWCNLHYGHHASKRARVELAQTKDLGYELLTALAIGDHAGEPLAPLSLDLRAADGVHSTRVQPGRACVASLDNIAGVMKHATRLNLGRPLVFIIDREADSVLHLRQWDRRRFLFVVRANDAPRVDFRGACQSLGAVADQLKREGKFRGCGPVLYKGREAQCHVAETSVVLRRPARQHRVRNGRKVHRNIKGKALTLRLVVSEVRDAQGTVLARWLLLTNLPAAVPAEAVAEYYHFRWRIESYHKLLKGAGQHLESWQQETPEAMARRLAVSAMAAVVVWRLAREQDPSAAEFREVLVQLSGRQMKRGRWGRPFTEPALMAGLMVLLPMLCLLEQRSPEALRAMVEKILPLAALGRRAADASGRRATPARPEAAATPRHATEPFGGSVPRHHPVTSGALAERLDLPPP